MKFTVTFRFEGSIALEVEAASAVEAEEKGTAAFDEIPDKELIEAINISTEVEEAEE